MTASMTTAELYIDLLIRALMDAIYGDVRDGSKSRNANPIARIKADEGRTWPKVAHTMVGRARLDNIVKSTQTVIDEGIPGDFIETGVWRGGGCILMRGVLAANGITDRHVYVADSFEGLPPPNAEKYPKDRKSTFHEHDYLAVSQDEVEQNFRQYNLLDDQVIFVKGFFSDTLPKLTSKKFSFLRLDGDMFESTYVALENLYPQLSPGGFITIDDYSIDMCRSAVASYRKNHGIEDEIITIDHTGVYWRKSGG